MDDTYVKIRTVKQNIAYKTCKHNLDVIVTHSEGYHTQQSNNLPFKTITFIFEKFNGAS